MDISVSHRSMTHNFTFLVFLHYVGFLETILSVTFITDVRSLKLSFDIQFYKIRALASVWQPKTKKLYHSGRPYLMTFQNWINWFIISSIMRFSQFCSKLSLGIFSRLLEMRSVGVKNLFVSWKNINSSVSEWVDEDLLKLFKIFIHDFNFFMIYILYVNRVFIWVDRNQIEHKLSIKWEELSIMMEFADFELSRSWQRMC